jgi:hypothetical protein
MRNEKRFAIPKERIQQLLPPMGSCIASDRIMVDGRPVGYMYREAGNDPHDSGWRFFAGDESQAYADEASHFALYHVNTVANYDPDMIPYLSTPAPCAFEKVAGTKNYRPVDPPEPEA